MPDRAMTGGPQRPVPPPGGWVLFWMAVAMFLYAVLFLAGALIWMGV